jgi:hypothetical protein
MDTGDNMPDETINKYDRLYGALHDVALFTKPTTIKIVQPLTGRTETFVIQTARHRDNGDYIFVECMDESGVVRQALPPKVSNAIASQARALTKRRRSISSRATMRARVEAGEVIGFKKRS